MQTKLIHEIRAVKNKQELTNISKAQKISEKVLKDTLLFLKTGVTEIMVANFIKKSFIKYQAPVLAFSPIVAFGKNTANIHHEPNKSKLKIGDSIMFDFGCTINGYCSDMTRTYFWGNPSKKQQKIYLAVLEAQNKVIQKMEQGERRAQVLDKVARSFLNKKFGKDAFPHGLGHGVGVVIHEWPNLKPKSEDILPTGCVMTVEPGIYLKKFGGVRIEDMILIGKNKAINITNISKKIEDVIIIPK